jgi:glutaredoxin-related protein
MTMRRELVTLTGGRWDVPQVFVDDTYLGDDDDLVRLAGSGELAALLAP